MSLYFTK